MKRLRAIAEPLRPRANAIATLAFMLGVAILLGTLFILAGPTGPVWLWVLQMVYFGTLAAVVIWKQIKVLAARGDPGDAAIGDRVE